MNADGSKLENVTNEVSSINAFEWSHGAGNNEIAYDQLKNGKWSIAVANTAGQGKVIVNTLSCNGDCLYPSWSSTNKELVYVDEEQSYTIKGETFNLMVNNLATGKILQVLNGPNSVKLPRFSDDGSSIFFLQAENSSSILPDGNTSWDLLIAPATLNGTSRNLMTGTFACMQVKLWTPQISGSDYFWTKPNNVTELLFSGSTVDGIDNILSSQLQCIVP